MIHYENWSYPRPHTDSLISISPKATGDMNESLRLVVGMLSAISGMVSMLSPGDTGNRFEAYVTPEYRLDYFDTVTGYKFVVLSEPNSNVNKSEVRADFERLYSLLFVPLVIRNPLFDPKKVTGNLRDSHCHVFLDELRSHFHSLLNSQTEAVPSVSAPQAQFGYKQTTYTASPSLI